MTKYFYKYSGDFYHLDGVVTPKGDYRLKVFKNNTVVSMVSSKGRVVLDFIEITGLLKQNGDSYIDLDELLSLTSSFFGGSAVVLPSSFPPIIEDSNTVGWYLSNDLSTITKDASDFMSEWRDFLGSGHDLLQAFGTSQFKWTIDGVLADGIDNFMQTLAFTFNQPEQIYMVFQAKSWASNDYFIDGGGDNTGFVRQTGTNPETDAYAGAVSSRQDFPLNIFGIIRILFNGASSKYIVNDNIPITGNFGSINAGGFTLGSKGSLISGFSNIQVKEILLRKIVDTAQDEQDIYDYLKNKYSIV